MMALEGLKLTFLGMGVVFLFLVVLINLIRLSTYLLAPFTKEEVKILVQKKFAQKPPQRVVREENVENSLFDYKKKVAVIVAAINKYREDLKQN